MKKIRKMMPFDSCHSLPTHCTIFSFSAHWMATSSKTVQKFEFDMMENATGAPPKSQ